MRDQARAEHADPDHVEDPGHTGARELLVDGHLLDRSQALASELLGPGDAGQPGLGELALPGAPRVDVGLVFRRARSRWRLVAGGLAPRARFVAVRGLLGSVVQVHFVSSVAVNRDSPR